MADRLRIGVILLQAVEDHCFFFGGMGIKPAHAPCFLHEVGVRFGTHEPEGDLAAWSDYSDAVVSAAYCCHGPGQLLPFCFMFEHGHDIEVCATIKELCEHCDAVMLINTGSLGDENLSLIEPVLRAGKPTFVDKFLAPEPADAQAMVDLAREHDVLLTCHSLLTHMPATKRSLASLNGHLVESVTSVGVGMDSIVMSCHSVAHLQLATGDRLVQSITARREDKDVIVNVTLNDGTPCELTSVGFNEHNIFSVQWQTGSHLIESICILDEFRCAADTIMRQFIDAARSGQTTLRPVDAMLNQVWTCNAITESLDTGQTITRG